MKKYLYFYTIIVAILFLPYVSGDLATGAVSYYTMDENNGSIAYDSVGSNNMNLTSTSWSNDSIINYSVNFGTRSNDYYGTIDNNFDYIQNTGVFTISFWWKPNDYTNGLYAVIMESNGLSGGNKGFGIWYSLGSTTKRMTFQLTNGATNIAVLTNDASYSSNEYINWILTGDGTNMRLYRNSVNVANTTYGTFATGAGSRSIVRLARDGASSSGQGLLDEIYFRNVYTNSTDVLNLYNANLALEQYPFTPPTPTNATNISVKANNNISSTSINDFSVIISGEVAGTETSEDNFEGGVDGWTYTGTGGEMTTSTGWSSWGSSSLYLRGMLFGEYAEIQKTMGNYTYLELDINKGGLTNNLTIWEGDYGTGTMLYSTDETGIHSNIYVEFSPYSNITIRYQNEFYVDNIRYNFVRQSLSTTNGTINSSIEINTSALYNFSFSSSENGGYYSRTYTSQNLTTMPFLGLLDPLYYVFGINYYNYTTYSGNDYVRLLEYQLNYTCPDNNPTNRLVYINGNISNNTPLTCNNVTNSITRFYIHPSEGSYDIIVGLQSSTFEENTTQETFISDLTAPTITSLQAYIPEGFSLSALNISIQCTDSIYPVLDYELNQSTTSLYSATDNNNTLLNVSASAIDGLIPYTFECSDPFDTTSETITETIYYKNISLINERTGELFRVDNLTNVRLILQSPNFNTTLNLKTLNVSSGFLLTDNEKNIRLELEYSDGVIITRDLNTLYIDSNASICANTDPTTHTEQFIISATIKPAIMRSNLHNCYVLADTTRFAFQNNFMAKYYSINTLYYLNTIKNGEEVLLASVDGGTGSTINLDTLSFGSTLFNVNFRESQVMIQKHPTSNTTLIIYFFNPKNDNVALDAQIFYNNSEYFASSTTTAMNNLTINFNYLTLSVDDDAIFKLIFTEYKEDGSNNTITTYYSLSGSSGSFPVGLAFVLGILGFISLITIVSPGFAFGYFGVFSTITAIFVMALSPAVWYSNLFIGVFIIIGIYQVLQYTNTNNVRGMV